MRPLQLTILLLISNFTFSQNICNCKGLVDIKYNSNIDILELPNGKLIKTIKQDAKNDNYLTFVILQDSLNHFKMTLMFGMKGDNITGWVKKDKYFTTTLNSYSEPVILYQSPNNKSTQKHKIDKWQDEYFPIINCKSNWTYIKIKHGDKFVYGWLDPNRQCNNPYTTCN